MSVSFPSMRNSTRSNPEEPLTPRSRALSELFQTAVRLQRYSQETLVNTSIPLDLMNRLTPYVAFDVRQEEKALVQKMLNDHNQLIKNAAKPIGDLLVCVGRQYANGFSDSSGVKRGDVNAMAKALFPNDKTEQEKFIGRVNQNL